MRRLPRNYHSHEYGTKPPPPAWMLAPARTVLPFLRAPLGYETAHPRPALIRTVKLIIVPIMLWMAYGVMTSRSAPYNLGHFIFSYFAIASFLLTTAIFLRREFGQQRGEEIHSAEVGYSWLTWYTTLPVMVCEQVIVPIALAGVGLGIAQTFSFELGWWLVAAGASYGLMAHWESRRRLAQTRATVDDKIRAQTFGERLDWHEERARRRPAASGSGTASSAPEPDMAGLGDYDTPSPERERALAGYMAAGRAGVRRVKGWKNAWK